MHRVRKNVSSVFVKQQIFGQASLLIMMVIAMQCNAIFALTFEDLQTYMRQNDGVSYAQYTSILRNGYLRWDASPREGASFAVMYGSTPGVYTSKRLLPGTVTTFALPVTLVKAKYYVTVKEVLGGKEGPAARELGVEKR